MNHDSYPDSTIAGILGSDRLLTYTTYAASQRQYCWSHATRNLLSAQELATTAAGHRFCREALALERRLFRLWHRFRGDPRVRGGPITRATCGNSCPRTQLSVTPRR